MDPGALDRPDVTIRTDSAPHDLAARPPAGAGDADTSLFASAAAAFRNGWMPLGETGVDAFLRAHPTFDGRGVLIAILDSGIDAGIPGLGTTSEGTRKIVDLRDFSGEGAVPLAPVTPTGDVIVVAGRRLRGYGRIAALATGAGVYGGVLRELPLGDAPAGDVNGNGAIGDSLPVVVVRATDGWVLFADTDGDSSFANERGLHDYLVAHETFGWSSGGRPSPLTVAVNVADGPGGAPLLDLFFDTSGHGSHVSGIAAGHDMYGVAGFNGVAPGALLLGCKIANDAQGGISTTGSMARALDYAIAVAARRRLPLVINMSFGVGNEVEGTARIDAIVDSVLALHPDVVFTVSAGNDGPGLSTLGFPGSAARVITVGATLPAAFLWTDQRDRGIGPVAFFSSRGGELAKPDIVTPGMAWSTVPRWDSGGEQESGTSMASPHAAGIVALLRSGLIQSGGQADARMIRQALMVTAAPLDGATPLDEGAGLPDVGRAFRWLRSGRVVPAVTARGPGGGAASAAYQVIARGGRPDTVATFTLAAQGTDTFRLRASAPWLHAPARVVTAGGRGSVRVTYDARMLAAPGVYTATVSGWTDDTLAGPAFRLINTVVVAWPAGHDAALHVALPPGGLARLFVLADSGRPFSIGASSAASGVTLYLHEPDGMPYRDGNGTAAGTGDDAAVYDVGAQDAVAGAYEVVAVAPPTDSAEVTIEIHQSPVRLALTRDRDGLAATITNVTDSALSGRAAVVLAGAERRQTIIGRGSEQPHLGFIIPVWARGVVVEVAMDRAEWSRFTDFGVTVFDSAGQQLGKEPLNYALGRLQLPVGSGHGDMPATLALSPGLAEPGSTAAWTVRVAIRLYADLAVTLPAVAGELPVAVTLTPHAAATVRFRLTDSPSPLGDGFFPLGTVVMQANDRLWTREAGLPSPHPPVMR